MNLDEVEKADGSVEFFIAADSPHEERHVATVALSDGSWEVTPAPFISWSGLRGRLLTKESALRHVRDVASSGPSGD